MQARQAQFAQQRRLKWIIYHVDHPERTVYTNDAHQFHEEKALKMHLGVKKPVHQRYSNYQKGGKQSIKETSKELQSCHER
jgi:hypothetical protein